MQADALALARQKMLEEARRKEEEEIRQIQIQKEVGDLKCAGASRTALSTIEALHWQLILHHTQFFR